MMAEGRIAGDRIDELDRRLIAELGSDPRISYADLGKRLGVSGMTAATRLGRLRAAGGLRICAPREFARWGLATEVLGLVQVELAALPAMIDALRASPYVLQVDRVTGEFDLGFHAIFPSELVLGELVRDLQALEGVRRIVVHHVIEHVKREEGWSAVFMETEQQEDVGFELAPGAQVPN